MRAPFEMTDGLSKLKDIIANLPPDSKHWDEATNRFQFIDRFVIECLGWERPNMRVEVTDDLGGRSDYILGNARAILEAKREAKIFSKLPVGRPSSIRKMRPLLAASPEFTAAVHQVLPYCVIHGAPIAIVCNGPQLAIFQALTPGMSPLDGECYFFNGFQSYIDFFPLLWTLLSPEGIFENRAHQDLAIHRNPRIPPKASEGIPELRKFRYRSEFEENLRGLSEVLLEEIEDNPNIKKDFYRECYVPLEANNQHLLLSKRIISARYRRVGGDSVTPSAVNSATGTGKNGDLLNDPAILSSGSRPIVVIGDVGVGKTSFFENLYESLDQEEKAETYFIHINLGLKANLTSDIKSHVLYEIPNSLNQKYGIDIHKYEFIESVYYREIKSFDGGVDGRLKGIDNAAYEKEKIAFLKTLENRSDAHLHASLGHLAKGRNKKIILIMDNADQRNFEVQQEAFLIAQELAATRNLLVFVALRPSTFYHSKSSGSLSGYQNKILTISPPPADEVVQKRLSFAVRVAEGKVEHAGLHGAMIKIGSVATFMNVTLRSIRNNEAIRAFLSNITGGNTRAVIELITGFCGSANVDSQKIVKMEEQYGNYRVPLHEFTKHALLGEYAYFNPQSSQVACNIYDTSMADPREHFLCGLVVAYLSSNVGVRDNDGFISGSSIIGEMSKLGFIEAQTRHALRRLATKKMIETPYAHYREIPVAETANPDEFYFRATSVGIYHIRFWGGAFTYLDATSTDTPIFDQNIRADVSDLAPSFSISDRYRKAYQFREYLFEQWSAANIGASYFDFVDLLQTQDKTFIDVKDAIDGVPKARAKGVKQRTKGGARRR
ncbi:hypothetical protein [Methylobacterium dankookense]|nr:hypothetical protein [Methylobacterium dankookense]